MAVHLLNGPSSARITQILRPDTLALKHNIGIVRKDITEERTAFGAPGGSRQDKRMWQKDANWFVFQEGNDVIDSPDEIAYCNGLWHNSQMMSGGRTEAKPVEEKGEGAWSLS